MLSETERWIKFYRIGLRWNKEEATRHVQAPTMSWTLSQLLRGVRNNTAVRTTARGTIATRLVDIKRSGNWFVLLFQLSDMNISDPVFSDLETGTLRQEPKLDGEGVCVTAHVVVGSFPMIEEEYPVPYVAAIEEVPGLNRTAIANFLKPHLHENTIYEFHGDDNRLKRTYVVPVFDLVADEKLGDALESSYLAGMELVETHVEPGGVADEQSAVIPVQRSMRLRVEGRPTGERARAMVAWAKGRSWEHAYNIVKVRFRRPEGRQKTVDVPVRVENAAEVLAGRSTRLTDFDEPMPQAVEEIRADIARKMIAELEDAFVEQ